MSGWKRHDGSDACPVADLDSVVEFDMCGVIGCELPAAVIRWGAVTRYRLTGERSNWRPYANDIQDMETKR